MGKRNGKQDKPVTVWNNGEEGSHHGGLRAGEGVQICLGW